MAPKTPRAQGLCPEALSTEESFGIDHETAAELCQQTQFRSLVSGGATYAALVEGLGKALEGVSAATAIAAMLSVLDEEH